MMSVQVCLSALRAFNFYEQEVCAFGVKSPMIILDYGHIIYGRGEFLACGGIPPAL